MQTSGLFGSTELESFGAVVVEETGVVTKTLSLQMAKLESPVVKTAFFKNGERCTVLTNQ